MLNPYRGCSHACAYCYVRNMPQFCEHSEQWGSFVDVKINAVQTLPRRLVSYHGKSLYLSSVTDPYQPIEKQYQLTRQLLERLLPVQPALSIQTKSSLVLRDLDLLRQFQDISVGFTIITTDEQLRQILEPGADTIQARIAALKTLKVNGLTTYIFVGPIMPYLTGWKEIIKATKAYTDYYYFDRLNTKGAIWQAIVAWLSRYYPRLLNNYGEIYRQGDRYWSTVGQAIRTFCQKESISAQALF